MDYITFFFSFFISFPFFGSENTIYAHWNTIHNHQVSMGRWMDKEIVLHTQWETTEPRKEWNPVICHNRAEPEGHYVKWSKSDTRTKDHMILPMWILKELNSAVEYKGLEAGILERCWSKDTTFQLDRRNESKRSIVQHSGFVLVTSMPLEYIQ